MKRQAQHFRDFLEKLSALSSCPESAGSPALITRRCLPIITSGISSPFSELSPTSRQITHVLRTLAPLHTHCIATVSIAFDLHVLSTPPAFVLSQNQTLRILKR